MEFYNVGFFFPLSVIHTPQETIILNRNSKSGPSFKYDLLFKCWNRASSAIFK